MKVNVEIEVTPEELRRFLGLPDVAGLQGDIVHFLREKVGAATDMDMTGFVRENFDALRKSGAWKNIVAKLRVTEPGAEAESGPSRRRRRKPENE
jgi:hypothetical protein